MSTEFIATVSLAAPEEGADGDLASVFSAYTACATVWLVLASAVGVILSLKFPL